jgi:hypothetical protein
MDAEEVIGAFQEMIPIDLCHELSIRHMGQITLSVHLISSRIALKIPSSENHDPRIPPISHP